MYINIIPQLVRFLQCLYMVVKLCLVVFVVITVIRISFFFHLRKYVFFILREVIAVNQDKLGKMGRRVVCIIFYV